MPVHLQRRFYPGFSPINDLYEFLQKKHLWYKKGRGPRALGDAPSFQLSPFYCLLSHLRASLPCSNQKTRTPAFWALSPFPLQLKKPRLPIKEQRHNGHSTSLSFFLGSQVLCPHLGHHLSGTLLSPNSFPCCSLPEALFTLFRVHCHPLPHSYAT